MQNYPVAKWHNIRYTRLVGLDEAVQTSDFEMSVADAVDTGVHNNLGVLNLLKVEWCGPAGPTETAVWKDITEAYKRGYHERTHYVS